ncbi:MAG: periplasmic heavy metal sensor [Burkholderiales bacterium]|nr:periplasmic heavy metal sensor [Burkholderiales bacterium]
MPMDVGTFRYPKLLIKHSLSWRTRCTLVAMLVIAAPAFAQAGNGALSGAAAAGSPHGEQAGAYQWGSDLGLSTSQRTAIDHIRDRARQRRWSLMGVVREEHARLRGLYRAPTPDRPAIDAALRTLRQLRRQMVGVSQAEHRRIEAILTPQQRDRLDRRLLRDDQQIW